MEVFILRFITAVIGWIIGEGLGAIIVGWIERKSGVKSAPCENQTKQNTEPSKNLNKQKNS